MRAVRCHDHGGPEVLTVEDVAAPEPGHGEVLVDVRAAAVNHVSVFDTPDVNAVLERLGRPVDDGDLGKFVVVP